MRKILLPILIICSSLLSCRQSEITPTKDKQKISWEVMPLQSINSATKSLIESYDMLENACTPEEDGGRGKSIGFFAELENSDGSREYDIFGTKETQLIYKKKIGSPQNWNYTRRNGEQILDDLEWKDGATYHIRAYYPQSLHNLIEESTVARCFVMNYNTHKTQEDLLVAYNRVYTVDPMTGDPSICIAKGPAPDYEETPSTIDSAIVDSKWVYGYNQPFNLQDPIPLFFQHSLAAIRVRFRFDFDYANSEENTLEIDDELLNCYFTNTDNENGLHTTGALVYGNEHLDELPHNTLEKYWKELTWKSEQSSMAGVPYYRWGLSQEDIDAGIKTGTTFSRRSTYNGGADRNVTDRMAVAYTKYPTQDINDGTTELVDAVNPLTMSLKAEAPYFNENEGWLLIIPQEAVSGLVFNFTTRRMGTVSAQVPPITMTGINGKIATLAEAITEQNYYLPGYRYTYTLTISETDIEIELGVLGWNEIYASEDIIF